jgi:hypothetical protein
MKEAASGGGLALVLITVMKIESSIVPVAGFGTNSVSTGHPGMWWIVVVVLGVLFGFFAQLLRRPKRH